MGKRAKLSGRAAVLATATPPYMDARLRIVGAALICAKLALVPVVFDQASDLPFTLPKSLLSHALGYALAGVIAGLLIQFGRSFLVWSWLHVPVLAFLLANIAATLFAADSLLALYGSPDRMVGLGTIADGVVLYFAIVLLVRTRNEALAAGLAFLTGSAVVLAYEAVQVAGRDPFSWSVDGSVRPFSTIGQTTNLAEYLTVVALGTAAVALFDGALRTAARAAIFLYSLLVLAGLLLTQTRSALIGVLAGGALLVALTWAAHPSRRARVVSLFGAIGGVLVLGAVLFLTPLGVRVLSTVELSAAAESDAGARLEQSAEVRIAFFRMALEMIRDRPIFGYGPDNILAAVPKYRSEHEPFEVQESPNTSAHGWVAQVAATSGLIGLLAYVATAAAAVWLTVRRGFRPAAWAALAMLVAYLGAGLTTVNTLSTDWLFWAALGGVGAGTMSQRQPDATEVGPAPGRRRQSVARTNRTTAHLVGFAVAGIGVLMALTTLTALDASRASRASQVSRLQGKSALAIEMGLRATQLDPRRARYWDTLGLAYISADRLTDAARAFEEAVKTAPYDVRYHGDLARAYVLLFQRGDRAAGSRATEVGETAARVDPNNPRANHTRAIAMQATGNMPEAVHSVERAMTLDQTNSPPIFLTATQVYLASGRTNDAIATARSAIARIGPPNTIPIRVELARALVASGLSEEAVKELDAALAIKPNDPAALQLRAQIIAGSR
jgi:O-antigen ligase/tetratricopeptide (TPR) repeat protein